MVVRSGVGVLAAVVVGATLGAVSRALMALVALVAGETPSFSWNGTAFILLLYAAVMVPGGAVAGLTTRRSRWILPAAGALFLCLPAVGVASEEVGSTAGFGPARMVGVWLTGAAVFATIALLPWLTVRVTDHWLGRGNRTGGPTAAAPAMAQPAETSASRRLISPS